MKNKKAIYNQSLRKIILFMLNFFKMSNLCFLKLK